MKISGIRFLLLAACAVLPLSSCDSADSVNTADSQPQELAAEVPLHGGQAIYQSCQPCHGDKAQGNAELKAPPLAGQNPSYLLDQLRKFKAGLRGMDPKADPQGHLMYTQTQAMTSEQMTEVINYIGTLELTPKISQLGGDAHHGKQLFDKHHCDSCHGLNGQGNLLMQAPRLQVLEDWYVREQLTKFVDGIRGGPKDIDPAGHRMADWVGRKYLPGKDIEDLASYIHNLEVAGEPD